MFLGIPERIARAARSMSKLVVCQRSVRQIERHSAPFAAVGQNRELELKLKLKLTTSDVPSMSSNHFQAICQLGPLSFGSCSKISSLVSPTV
jgi:hypothetical protein